MSEYTLVLFTGRRRRRSPSSAMEEMTARGDDDQARRNDDEHRLLLHNLSLGESSLCAYKRNRDGLVSDRLFGQADDSLDEPLHLEILTSLASSLARHPAVSVEQDAADLRTIVDGLPEATVASEDTWVSFDALGRI